MPKRKRNLRWVKWLVFLVLIAGAVTMAILVKNNFDKKTDDSGRQTTNTEKHEEKKDDDKNKNQNSDDTKETPKQEEKAPQYEGDSPNKADALSGVISYADVVGDDLTIRVNIDQFLSEGNCTINIIKNGSVAFTQTAGIVESVSTSTCDGYKIPTSTLPKGDLQLEVLVQSGNRSGKITSRVRI